jgi:2-oxo-4-hydroxy-4-carboxy-5-ureidoimidazoline decarboxylase
MESWQRLDAAPPEEARALLRSCCGYAPWVDRMLKRRPFGSREGLLAAAREEWLSLSPADWREAFSHHPKIGELPPSAERSGRRERIEEKEQAGVSGAPRDVLTALAEGNREYERRFGYIFIVCATGRSAEEMLSTLRTRLRNAPDDEIRVAAEEHARITELRLLRL